MNERDREIEAGGRERGVHLSVFVRVTSIKHTIFERVIVFLSKENLLSYITGLMLLDVG